VDYLELNWALAARQLAVPLEMPLAVQLVVQLAVQLEKKLMVLVLEMSSTVRVVYATFHCLVKRYPTVSSICLYSPSFYAYLPNGKEMLCIIYLQRLQSS
jgi:hypothetical protein